MVQVVREGNIKARKRYICNGSIDIDNTGEAELTEATDCKGFIEKGQEHYRQVCVNEGDIYNWRSCLPCLKVVNDSGILEE